MERGRHDIAMRITSELLHYGYEGDPTDGHLGPDERLIAMVGGSLKPGESYTYTHEPCLGARYIYGRGYTYKGRKQDLQVEIVTNPQREPIGYAKGMGEQCVRFTQSVPAVTAWHVTVTNTTGRLVRRAALRVLNEMELGQMCPQ